MSAQKNSLKQRIFAFMRYAWGYSGTLAVLSLLLGVLGMGVYHFLLHEEPQDASARSLFFTGMVNYADALPPEGVGSLPLAAENLKGMRHIRLDYSPQGQCVRAVHVGTDGAPACMPGSRVAEQRISYDAAGRMVRKANFDAAGAAVEDATGVAVREYAYDEAGRTVRRTLKNARGQLVVPRMPGYAEQRIRYDAQGRPLQITHWDGKGKPIINSDGESEVRFSYSADGLSRKRVNYVNGAPCNNAHGIAVEKKTLTHDALNKLTVWQDAQSHPVMNPACGACSLLEYKTPSARSARSRMCNSDGMAMLSARACCEHVVRTDARGRVEWECYQGADGMPCNNESLGYAERVCEYAADGTLLREYFWDASGKPALCFEKRHMVQDGLHYVLSLHSDGSTAICVQP